MTRKGRNNSIFCLDNSLYGSENQFGIFEANWDTFVKEVLLI
jgi:hypothetical protein